MKINTDKVGAVPFWFWNGEQQEAEIERQLEFAKAGGWRGLAVHARSGNRTEYLSDRWMELVRFTCTKAKELGLEIWLYDEEGFPSGSVGERLPALGEEYQQKLLRYHFMTGKEAKNLPHVVAVFARQNLERRLEPSEIADDMDVLVFQRVIRPWMTDYLSPKAAAKFLEMTHEKYERAVGEFLGDPMTVLYTDDMLYSSTSRDDNTLPWNDDLPQVFQRKFGYSLLDNLAKLTENVGDYRPFRRDFRRCCSELLNETFVQPMQRWAAAHNMLFTGHTCGDEGPFTMMDLCFGDPAAFYMTEDIPGVDDFLTANMNLRFMSEPRNEFDFTINGVKGFPITTVCKQASSIGSQLKHGKCSAEVLTSMGWGVPVKNQMAQMFFELALGINIFVHHDCSYTTEAMTKYDHPASFFFQQPYFTCNNEIYRPFKRSLALMERGRIDADVLVMYPIYAAFEAEDGLRLRQFGHAEPNADYPTETSLPAGTRDADFYTDFLQRLNLALLRCHISFEYGHELAMERFGRAEGGKMVIGDCAYSTVLLPAMDIPAKLQPLFREFANQGGKIITIETPEDIPAGLPKDIAGEIPAEVVTAIRLVEGKREYYLVNYAETAQMIRIAEPGDLELFDPLSGSLITENGAFPRTFLLPPLKSCHILPAGTLEDTPNLDIFDSVFAAPETASAAFFNEWKIRRENENALLIDYAVNKDGEVQLFEADVPFVKDEPYTFPFVMPEDLNLTRMRFCFEPVAFQDMTLNGCPLNNDTALNGLPAHPCTQALSASEIGWILRNGENRLVFSLVTDRPQYGYLTGDFNVVLNGGRAELCRKRKLRFGNLAEQGLPFYWGTVDYETSFELDEIPEHLFLQLGDVKGVVECELNGRSIGVLYGAPWEFRLPADALREGHNRLTLYLRNTAQNFLGPHRNLPVSRHFTGWNPENYDKTKPDAYTYAEFGILSEPQLVVRTK